MSHVKECSTYSGLDLIDRGPSGPFCGLGGRDPEKKGWANLASALAARWEYLGGGGGGGGAGERAGSDMVGGHAGVGESRAGVWTVERRRSRMW